MFDYAQGRLRHQIDLLRRQFVQGGGLPFADALSFGGLEEALRHIEAAWNDRIYPRRSPSGSSSARFLTPTSPAAPPSRG